MSKDFDISKGKILCVTSQRPDHSDLAHGDYVVSMVQLSSRTCVVRKYDDVDDKMGWQISIENLRPISQQETAQFLVIERGDDVKESIGRQFESGAYRDVDDGKFDYEAFLSPIVLESYAEYMHKNRRQSNGEIRDGDNWQKGLPKEVYMKSMWRHFHAVWKEHRGIPTEDGMEDNLNGLLFNVMGYLFEKLKADADFKGKLREAIQKRNKQPLVCPEGDHGPMHNKQSLDINNISEEDEYLAKLKKAENIRNFLGLNRD